MALVTSTHRSKPSANYWRYYYRTTDPVSLMCHLSWSKLNRTHRPNVFDVFGHSNVDTLLTNRTSPKFDPRNKSTEPDKY